MERNSERRRSFNITHIPQVRPHYHRRAEQLYFLISRRPSLILSPEDIGLFEDIDGRKTAAELTGNDSRLLDRLHGWYEAGVIELIPPICPPSGPHLLVVEPHMDDAALSVGGRLLHRRGKDRITILTVVKHSNFTKYLDLKQNFFDIHAVTTIRLEESMLAARLLGGQYRCMSWTDAPLRFLSTTPWSLDALDQIMLATRVLTRTLPDPRDVSTLAEQLLNEVEAVAPDELWIPMGLGHHVDHRTVRSACVMMLGKLKGRLPNLQVAMYEDVPYNDRRHAAQIVAAFAAAGTRLVRSVEDIADVFAEKLRIVCVFASQFEVPDVEARVRAAAQSAEVGTLTEVIHRLEGSFALPDEIMLATDGASVQSLRDKVRTLSLRRNTYRRVTIVALPSAHFGRWRTSEEILTAAFSNAVIRAYVAKEVGWQLVADDRAGQIKEITVPGGRGNWMAVLLRELGRFRTPTVILWSGAEGQGGRCKRILFRSMLPFRRVVFSSTLAEFCNLLAQELKVPQCAV